MIRRLRAALRYPADWAPEALVVAVAAVVTWEAAKALWRALAPAFCS